MQSIWRQHFPFYSQNPEPIAFLDSAASSQMCAPAVQRMHDYALREHANVHRGVYALSAQASMMYDQARADVAQCIGAPAKDVVFTRNATEGINCVAHAFLVNRVKKGDEIIITALEHHANIVPWVMLAKSHQLKLRVVPLNEERHIDAQAVTACINDRTALIAIAHASNVLGCVLPVQAICAVAQQHQVPVLVDGAQAIAHQPINIAELGCDFYVFSGHKVYGPTGIGVLVSKHLDTMQPYQTGGGMIQKVAFDEVTFASGHQRFEAGTPNIQGALGLAEAMKYVREQTGQEMSQYEASLWQELYAAVIEIKGVHVYSPQHNNVGVLTFNIEGVHAHDTATILDQHHVAVRAGHHCAMPLMKSMGAGATVRASIALYNQSSDVEQLVKGIHEVKRGISSMNNHELYQQMILDHGRHPRHYGVIANATHTLQGINAVCGDEITISAIITNQQIQAAGFTGEGCAICMASTSMMLEKVQGISQDEVIHYQQLFSQAVKGQPLTATEEEQLGKLMVLQGVAQFPMRIKCATLCWHTMTGLCNGSSEPMSTESDEAGSS